MFKYASLIGATAAKYWWMDCDFKGADYEKYKFYPFLLSQVDCRDACQAAHSYMFARSDLNNDMMLDKCELSLGCIGSQKFEDPADCVQMAEELEQLTFKDVIKGCAQQYKDLYCPAVKGIPFAEGDKTVEALKTAAFLSEGQAKEIASLLPKGAKLSKAYVAKEDGWTNRDFHSLVDGKGATLTIIRNHVNYVFGGYTDIPWSNTGGSKVGKGNSFQFYFTNGTAGTGIEKVVPQPGGGEVHHRSDLITSFNDGIWVYENCNVNRVSNSDFGGRDYELPSGTHNRQEACLAVTGINDPSWSTYSCLDIETWFVEL